MVTVHGFKGSGFSPAAGLKSSQLNQKRNSMNTTKKTIQDPDLARVEAALLRAAQRARKRAKDTGTPLVIYKDGKIILQRVDDDETQQE